MMGGARSEKRFEIGKSSKAFLETSDEPGQCTRTDRDVRTHSGVRVSASRQAQR